MTVQSDVDNWRLSQRGAALTDSAIRALTKRMAGRANIVSFAGGMPSPATFPQAEFSRAFERVMHLDGTGALQYGPTNGHAPLRDWIAQSLSVSHQSVSPEQVLVVSGSQQGLDLIGKVLLDTGDVVGVESPTYLGALQALGQYFAQFVTLPCDAGGLIPEQIEAPLVRAQETGRPAKLLYTIPTFQNPSGRTLSMERRIALLQACRRLRLPLVEDDPYGGLDHAGRKHVSCMSIDGDNVVYLGSFSKVLSPGIRLGYIVAPLHIARKLELAKQASDLHSSSLLQRLVFEIVKDGFLTQHLQLCQAVYRDHAVAMSDALERHMRDLANWEKPQGGMFQWLEFADDIDASALLEDAMTAGVAYVPGAPFYAHEPRRNTARLCFSTSSTQDIDKGIALLSGVVRAVRDAR